MPMGLPSGARGGFHPLVIEPSRAYLQGAPWATDWEIFIGFVTVPLGATLRLPLVAARRLPSL